MSNLRVLFIGPFPPPLGGAIVESLNLIGYLEERADVNVTKIRTNDSLCGVLLSPFVFLMSIFKVDTVFLYGSHRGISRLSVLLVPLCRLFRTRCVVKITGGNLWEYYADSHPIWKKILRKTLLSRCLLLLETNYLIQSFAADASNIRWLPMTRRVSNADMRSTMQAETVADAEKGLTSNLKIVYFGHIRVEKGILELIEASNKISGVDIDAYGEFIGLDESCFKAGKVNYQGVVQPDEVVETMSKYDVMTLPSFYPGEGYPGVLIEAKNAGLAVVSTQWRSIPEIIEHNKNGLLVKPKDTQALANAFQKLESDRDLLERLQKNSAQSFANYDIDKWGQVFVEYLRG